MASDSRELEQPPKGVELHGFADIPSVRRHYFLQILGV
jgi:hypothetical protein